MSPKSDDSDNPFKFWENNASFKELLIRKEDVMSPEFLKHNP